LGRSHRHQQQRSSTQGTQRHGEKEQVEAAGGQKHQRISDGNNSFVAGRGGGGRGGKKDEEGTHEEGVEPYMYFDEAFGYGSRSKAELLQRMCKLPPPPPPPPALSASPTPPSPSDGNHRHQNHHHGSSLHRPLCCAVIGLVGEKGYSPKEFSALAQKCPITIRL